MSNEVKDIDIKKQTHYLFNDITNIKNFDSNNIKIDEKYSYLLQWVCDNKKFRICKHY